AQSGTLRDFFGAKNVQMVPQKAQNFSALDITLPMPPGWTPVPDPNVSDAFVVTANRRSASLYTSNAQLVVYRLIGEFDPKEAITHGYLDSAQLPAWRTTNASLADFNGSPSSIIEGTYRDNEWTLNTSRRHVIVTAGPDKYLVSLSVTTDAATAVAEAPATDAIVNGFRAGPPGSNPPAVPAPPPAAPAPVAAPPSATALAH
ncbi:LpqN/LpqT family lipoprotein, partial [Mycobacterium sp.]|uniref:LpqN/LpqT family lipoprotein n=1 Tax=Mycobacterium sp. TaxID=1785 RepID=UPI003C736311